MKKVNFILSSILALTLLLSSCGTDEVQGSETDTSPESTAVTVNESKPVTLGGIPIGEISEIGYLDENLKASADRIADKLREYGASELSVHEGAPTGGKYAVELGCGESDARLKDIEENQAIITSDGKVLLAAVKGDTFDDKYAVNVLETFIGDEKYSGMFTRKIKLHSAEKIDNGAEPIIKSSDYSSVYFSGMTVGDPTAFKIGDVVIFEIKLMQGNKNVACNSFKYEIICDDGKSISGTVDGSGGALRLTTSITSPGFVRVIVTALNEYGNEYRNAAVFEGGAGANISEIEQSLEEPSDFDAFWLGQLSRLDWLGLEVLSKTEMPSGKDGFVAFDVQLNCVDGSMPASGVLTMPKNAVQGSLKAKMCFVGYGAPAPLAPICEENTIVFYVNPHGVPNYGKDNKYYTDFHSTIKSTYNGKEYNFGFNPEQNLTPETSYYLNMILRDVQAARYLLTLAEYDGKGIEFYSGSMGAMQAMCTANLIGESNVKCMNLNYPWLANFGCATVGLMGPFWGPEPTDANGKFTRGVLYFDPVNHAKRIKCEVNIESCLGDYICPPSGQVVLYKALASDNKKLTFYQNSTHAYTAPNAKTYTLKW